MHDRPAAFAPPSYALRRTGYALAAVAALASCGGGGDVPSGPAPVAPALVAVTPTVVPGGVLVARTVGTALPAGTLTATIGGTALAATRLDDSTFALAVPTIAPGAATFSAGAQSGTLSGTVQVVAAPQVADPQAFLDGNLLLVEQRIDSVDAGLNDRELVATADDSASLRATARMMRDSLASARVRLAALSAEDRAKVAAIVAARLEALKSAPVASVVATRLDGVVLPRAQLVLGAGAAEGFCLTAYQSYEECGTAIVSFSDATLSRLVILTGITAAAYVEGLTGVGSIAAVVTGVIAYKEMNVLENRARKRFQEPVFGDFADDVSSLSLSGDLRASMVGAASSGAATEYFVSATSRRVLVRGRYHSISAADASRPGRSALVARARRVESLINVVRHAFLLGPMPTVVPASSLRVTTAIIPARFLSVSDVSLSGVTTATGAVGDTLTVKFTRAGVTSDLPFTFDVRYAPPGLAPIERTVPAALIATPRFIARSLVPANGGSHTCAIGTDDAVYCWGFNGGGQFGDHSNTNRNRAHLVRGPNVLASLNTMISGGCGLAGTGGFVPAGTALCWGIGTYKGEIVPDDEDPLRTVVADSGRLFAHVASGNGLGCGSTGAQTRCWGIMNDSGNVHFPETVPGAGGLRQLVAGLKWACGLNVNGAAFCWGYNQMGGLGNGGGDYSKSAVAVSGGLTFASLTMGEAFACGLTAAGKAYCWGRNEEAQLGTGTGTTAPARTPVAAAPSLTFVSLHAGFRQACGVTSAGAAYCWGNNRGGALGNGTLTSVVSAPTQISSTVAWKQVVLGDQHGCGLSTGGAVYCWGDNFSGQLGDGSTINNSLAPVSVAPPAP